jgi:hypothetical protein
MFLYKKNFAIPLSYSLMKTISSQLTDELTRRDDTSIKHICLDAAHILNLQTEHDLKVGVERLLAGFLNHG